MQGAVAGAGDEDLLVADTRAPEITRCRPVLFPPQADPVPVPDGLQFAQVLFGVIEPVRGQRLPVRLRLHEFQ
jgi:hypothetical protein